MSEITAELDSIKGQINGCNGLPAAHLKMTQEVAALSMKLNRIFEYMIQQKATETTTPMSKTPEDEGQELDPNTQDQMDEEMIPTPRQSPWWTMVLRALIRKQDRINARTPALHLLPSLS